DQVGGASRIRQVAHRDHVLAPGAIAQLDTERVGQLGSHLIEFLSAVQPARAAHAQVSDKVTIDRLHDVLVHRGAQSYARLDVASQKVARHVAEEALEFGP